MEDIKEVVSDEPTMEDVAKGVAPDIVSEVKAEPETIETEIASEIDPLINQDKVQEKINKISAEKNVEKRKREAAEARIAELENVKPALPADAPKLEDFDYDDGKHQEAVIAYQVQKALETQNKQATQAQIELGKQKVANDYFDKASKYVADNPGYEEDIKALPIFNQEALNAIYELGPQVTHYLAKHLDVANEVASASPTMAAVKLGQISIGLTADSKPVKPSTAPEPPATISGGAAVTKSQEDMSMDEIMALP